MIFKTFRISLLVAVLALVGAFLYASTTGLALAAILAVLEISLSFDNAVVNAGVLVRMSEFWQRIFLTIGVLIAVFGMRLVFPLLIVGITAHLSPVEAVRLALDKGDPGSPGSYGYLLKDAHPAIGAFGGAFLLLLFLDFLFDQEREIQWLTWIEKPLARIGRLDQLSVVVTLLAVAVAAYTLAPGDKVATVLVAGVLGTVTYVLVNGLGELFNVDEENADETAPGRIDGGADEPDGHSISATREPRSDSRRAAGRMLVQTGKAAFFSFLYLEVLDASFSFDGVIGAFAITSDPVIIAIGLGIGAMFIRSLTVLLVRTGTLAKFVYLEHGALWAIGALAVLLLLTIRYEVPEVITGLIGAAFIALSVVTSIVHQRHHPEGVDADVPVAAVTSA